MKSFCFDVVRACKVFTTLTLLLLSAGCILKLEYRFVHLSTPPFAVTEIGRSAVAERALFVHDHEDMPIAYVADHQSYTITATMDLNDPNPNMAFTAHEPGGTRLLLMGIPLDDCFGVFYDANYHGTRDKPEATIVYRWFRRGFPGCRELPEPIHQILAFELDVLRDDGTLIATEVVSFSIEANGSYYRLDGP